jgi:o-succinylbenzoate synthase
MKLFRYTLSTPLTKWPMREGIILQEKDRFAEIAPLPFFSKETLDEALDDLYGAKKTPSVQFALSCLEEKLTKVRVKIAPKLKLGHLSVFDAIALVKMAKKPVRVDCNRKWTLAMALEFAKAFHKEEFDYIEEPVGSWEELIAFSKATGFPIAIDESIHENWSEIVSLKAIVVKPTLLGKIPDVPKPLKLILSSSYESGIGLLHIARLGKDLEEPLGIDTVFPDNLLETPIARENSYFSWEPSENPVLMEKLCPIVR